MSSPTVFIVEDDPALLRGLKDNFIGEGYNVRTFSNGLRAAEAIAATAPDLLLLDLMLPGKSGYEICEAARLGKQDFPIIMLTARGQEEDIVRGLDLGADDYVTKPFGIKELLARVKALLRRRSKAAKEHRFGNFRLDLEAHKLFKNREEISLTAKEFRLLEFFAQSTGKALTRDRILDSVWGNEVLVTDRSVDRCVTTLRGKIEADPRRPVHIQTIRDIGYRFEIE